MSAELLITLITPLVVFGATELVKVILPKLQGWGIVALVVPLLSLAVTAITNVLSTPDLSWLQQFGIGLFAVFVRELVKQLGQLFNPQG